MKRFSFRSRNKDKKLSNSAVTVLETASLADNDALSNTSVSGEVCPKSSVDAKGPLGLNLISAPSEPLFDFIFVHGLGGGSRKTWSKTSSMSHYWPGQWLPKEKDFEHVRIHSYGYDSDWTKGSANCLNLHHIGKSLLGELSTCPHITDSSTNLVLIGHSMGGLVIKKAYMLAEKENKPLARRVRAIYFLATPHRGSDSAKLLRNVIQVASSAPAFVTDLVRGSGALQSINDEFRQYSADIELWSFYETQKLRASGLSTLIVDPESATLGYREEKQMPMNADHRSICKFETLSDPNYIIIRNSLISTIKNIATTGAYFRTGGRTIEERNLIRNRVDREALEVSERASIESLANFLGISDEIADDRIGVQEARVPGTCEWILEKPYFVDWKDQRSAAPPILWMDGQPATGKSVLAGFIIDDLIQSGSACSSYFFKHSDRAKSRLSASLRALAFQMATTDPGVRDMLMALQRDHLRIDHENERSLWRALFMPGIFDSVTVPHFWVIDALDECSNFAPLLDSMLRKMDTKARVRIFITSRKTPELCRLFSGLGPTRHTQGHISADETLPDIECIVAARGQTFFTDSEENRTVLEKRIIEKSKGSFLWTLLVLDELSTAFSEEEIEHVLDEVPRGMEPLYHRALETMALATRGKKLAKAILTWTTCVMRPLTLRELECALEIDLQDKFPRLQDTIRTLCGQLITVDKHGKVQMVHETAREFLLDEELDSELSVNQTEAHTRIARVCLEYLTGDQMKPPRAGRRGPNLPRPSKNIEFLAYASGMFSQHLAKSSPAAEDVLALASKFLKLNILTWIENVAQKKNLGLMIRAAADLKIYAKACMVERSPLRRDLQDLRSWSIDLQRIAGKFADALIASPSIIYSRIPPFCPTNSTIHEIATPGKKVSVTGLPASAWDDRMSCLDYGGYQTSALCYGEELLAVGLRGGRVAVYHPTSCQEFRAFDHGETVMHFRFREKSDMLASSGLKTIRVWDVRTGQQLYHFPSPLRCIGLIVHGNLLLAASSQNQFSSWDMDNGEPELVKASWLDWMEDGSRYPNRWPSAISIAVAHGIMAVAYAGRPITVWDLEQEAFIGTCGKKLPSGETSTHPVVSVLMNPNPNIELLAASYLDGELAIIDPFADIEVEKQRVNCHTLAASPDGRLLAGGGGAGIIQIFEFDTLRLLYKVKTSDLFIKTLAFSYDGTSLADLRGSQCSIWTPPVLLAGASLEDDMSIDTFHTAGDLPNSGAKVKVTAMALMSDKQGVLCGQDDGSVCLYDITTGDRTTRLYSHKAAIHTLCWLPWANIVMSTCLGNGVLAWSLQRSMQASRITWTAAAPLLNFRLGTGSTIVHLLPAKATAKFIMSTHKSDHLWDRTTRNEVCAIPYDHDPPRTWLQHPRSESHVICMKQELLDIHRWEDLSKIASVPLGHNNVTGLSFKGVFPSTKSGSVLLDLTDANGSSGTQDVLLLRFDFLPEDHQSVEAIDKGGRASSHTTGRPDKRPTTDAFSATRLGTISGRISHVLGILGSPKSGSKILFLDTRSWVCSIDLSLAEAVAVAEANAEADAEAIAGGGKSMSMSSYTRHFFVPYDWFAGTRNPIGGIASYGDVVFAKGGDIAVIKGGLEYAEMVDVGVEGEGGRG